MPGVQTEVKGRTQPLPSSVPIENPYARLSQVSPYVSAASPYAAVNPYGGGAGGKPPRSPYAASPYAEEPGRGLSGPKGSALRGSRSFSRRIIVALPPRVPPAQTSSWVLPYDTVMRIWGEFNECIPETESLHPGNGLDFTFLAECAAQADHQNNYCPFVTDRAWGDGDEQPEGCPGRHGLDAERLGEGQELWSVSDDLMDEWRACGDYYDKQHPLDLDECQVLVFERTRDGGPALEGKYLVTNVVNHVWTPEDRPDDAPLAMIGYREVYLAPCGENWDLEG